VGRQIDCFTRIAGASKVRYLASCGWNSYPSLHLALLNRGVLITPFHNMMLVCPDTTEADVARLLDALDDVLAQLTGP